MSSYWSTYSVGIGGSQLASHGTTALTTLRTNSYWYFFLTLALQINHNVFEDVCPVKSAQIIVEPLQQCWTICLSVLWENNLSCIGCSTNGVGNGRPTADVKYPDEWVGLIELMHLFQFEEVKWSHITGTVVHLKRVLGVELVPVILSKHNPFRESVGGSKQVSTIISPSGSRLVITTWEDWALWQVFMVNSHQDFVHIAWIQNLRSAYVNHVPH